MMPVEKSDGAIGRSFAVHPYANAATQIPTARQAVLRTPPGERRVLAIVLAGRVVPRKTKRVHVALHGMRERETIRGGMTRVVEMKRLGGVRVHSHGRNGGHVDEVRRDDRPARSGAIETDWRGLDAEKFSDQARQRRHRAASAAAGDGHNRLLLLRG